LPMKYYAKIMHICDNRIRTTARDTLDRR
jgi:hypothetical protein